MGVHDDAEPFEFVEVAVDRRDGNVGSLHLDFGRQLLGGAVSLAFEEQSKKKPPRRGDATAVLTQQFQRPLDCRRISAIVR